jgi:chromosomal replication initiation ATPase DnaA
MFVIKPKKTPADIAAVARAKLAAEYALYPKLVTKRKLGFAAAAVFATPFEEIVSKSCAQTVYVPRCAIALLARERLKLSYPEIGRFMKRDHSTIMHACERGRRLLAEEADFAARCAEIETLLWPSNEGEPLSRSGEGQG